eukprot:1159063-Pelagomonas_calceolata.AAC.5
MPASRRPTQLVHTQHKLVGYRDDEHYLHTLTDCPPARLVVPPPCHALLLPPATHCCAWPGWRCAPCRQAGRQAGRCFVKTWKNVSCYAALGQDGVALPAGRQAGRQADTQAIRQVVSQDMKECQPCTRHCKSMKTAPVQPGRSGMGLWQCFSWQLGRPAGRQLY